MADCGNALEEVLGVFLSGAGEGFDEDYLGGRLGFGCVESLYTYGHVGSVVELRRGALRF